MPTVAGNGTLFRGAADVVFRPAGFTGTITDDWASVPWCNTDFAPYDDKTADHLAAIHDPTRGIGDICRYMGGGWRIPTAAEIAELYGSDQINGGEARRIDNNSDWSPGLFAPLHGDTPLDHIKLELQLCQTQKLLMQIHILMARCSYQQTDCELTAMVQFGALDYKVTIGLQQHRQWIVDMTWRSSHQLFIRNNQLLAPMPDLFVA